MNYLEDAKEKIEGLTDEQIEAAYRYKEMLYNIDDAESRMRDYLEEHYSDSETEKIMNTLESSDYEILAEQFMDNHDCNVADNEIWRNLVSGYIEENRDRFTNKD